MKTIIFIILIISHTISSAQSSVLGNSTSLNSDYLGWDSNTTMFEDLNIQHRNPDQSIIFSTNSVDRMYIQNGMINMGNSFVIQDRKLGIHQKNNRRGITAYCVNGSANSTDICFQSDHAQGNSFTTHAENFGIYASSVAGTSPAKRCIGLEGFAEYGLTNYGVYGFAPISANNAAGYFNGDVVYNGIFTFSDLSLKENIQEIQNARDLLLDLNPKIYFFDTENQNLNLPVEEQFGFLAQEVEQIIPHMVKIIHAPKEINPDGDYISDSLNFKALNYTQLIPILIAGSQVHDISIETHIDLLQEIILRLESLEGELRNTKSPTNTPSTN